jgi:O-antigen ligase
MSIRSSRRSQNFRIAILLILLSVCFLCGGASRLDVMSLIILQPLAALAAVLFVMTPGPIGWSGIRVPLLFLGALGGLMIAQLIPLPPGIWTQLPGHGPFAESALAAGLAQPWRPISLTPDLTLASLVGLVVPLAVLIGFASVTREHRTLLLSVLVVGLIVSAIIGLAQIAGGPQSPFYLFEITNRGLAVGLFSNRNHQAVFLAMGWPILVAWTVTSGDRRVRTFRLWFALAFSIFLIPLLLVTGSRGGLLLGVLSFGVAMYLWRLHGDLKVGWHGELGRLTLPVVGLAALGVLVASIVFSRDEAFQRILRLDAADDGRAEFGPTAFEMARDFFPVGSGFGSFDPVFRAYEPLEVLGPQYVNHAHNDWLELVITGGLPAALLGLLFVGWLAARALRLWRSADRSPQMALARAASIMVLLVLLSSIVDYPLRTPLIAAIMAIACGWLGEGLRTSRSEIMPRSGFTHEPVAVNPATAKRSAT